MKHPDLELQVNWAAQRFSCDSQACQRPCCEGATLHDGILLTLDDLLRLGQADLLQHAQGHFLSQQEATARLEHWPTPAALRRSWPQLPRLATSQARCALYDGVTQRCRHHAARPRLCRSFPYELNDDPDDATLSASFSVACSLVADYGHNARMTPITEANRTFRRALPVLEGGPYAWAWQRKRMSELHPTDREGVEHCLARDRETYAAVFVVAHHPHLLTDLGLGRFAHPDDRATSAAPPD